MKKIVCLSLLLVLLTSLMGCNSTEELNYAEIADGVTGEVVTSFYLAHNEERMNVLLDANNYREETEDKINEPPKYIVHMADVKEPYYDIWYNIYIENDKLYLSNIVAKEAYSEQMNIPGDIRKCTKVSPTEFMKIINDYDSDNITETIDIDATVSQETKNPVSAYLAVLDFKTEKEITRIIADSRKDSTTIMDAYNFYTVVPEGISFGKPKYIVHYFDENKDKSSEIWFNVYIHKGELYTERLAIKGSQLENSDTCYELHHADNVTVKDFLEAIDNKD